MNEDTSGGVEVRPDTAGLVAYERVPSAEALIARAIEHGVGVEALERLLAMRERLKAESAREAFCEALSAFQSECPVILKTKQSKEAGVSNFRYKYASLDVIVSTVQ